MELRKVFIDGIDRVLCQVCAFLSGSSAVLSLVSFLERRFVESAYCGAMTLVLFGLSYLAYRYSVRFSKMVYCPICDKEVKDYSKHLQEDREEHARNLVEKAEEI